VLLVDVAVKFNEPLDYFLVHGSFWISRWQISQFTAFVFIDTRKR